MARLTSIKSGIYFNNKKEALARSLTLFYKSVWARVRPVENDNMRSVRVLVSFPPLCLPVCVRTESSYCSSPLLLAIFACLCVACMCVCVRTQKWIFFRHSITISAAPISPAAHPISSSLGWYWKTPRQSKGGEKNKWKCETICRKTFAAQTQFWEWEKFMNMQPEMKLHTRSTKYQTKSLKKTGLNCFLANVHIMMLGIMTSTAIIRLQNYSIFNILKI